MIAKLALALALASISTASAAHSSATLRTKVVKNFTCIGEVYKGDYDNIFISSHSEINPSPECFIPYEADKVLKICNLGDICKVVGRAEIIDDGPGTEKEISLSYLKTIIKNPKGWGRCEGNAVCNYKSASRR